MNPITSSRRNQTDLVASLHSDDGTLLDGNGVKVLLDHLGMAMSQLGRIPVVTDSKLVQLLENAGFEDITVAMYKQPSGPWPKDPKLKHVGTLNLLSGVTGRNSCRGEKGMNCADERNGKVTMRTA